jgi:hypothetical protein
VFDVKVHPRKKRMPLVHPRKKRMLHPGKPAAAP